MLPVRLLALIVALFFSIALVPGFIKVPERMRRDTPEPVAIAKVPEWSNVPKAADQSAEGASKREQPRADLANLLTPESSEPAAISSKQAGMPTAPEIAEVATPKPQPPIRDISASFHPPEEPGSDVVAHKAERHDLTGSVQPPAPAVGNAMANRAIENPLVALPVARTAQKPTVRKVLRPAARAKAPTSPGYWPTTLSSANAARANAYTWKPAELPPPNFTNSGY
jgi:hypothetical protein